MAHFWCIVPFQIMCFGRGQTSLKGIITSPYPEVNLDNFSFPVGGCFCLIAWQLPIWGEIFNATAHWMIALVF